MSGFELCEISESTIASLQTLFQELKEKLSNSGSTSDEYLCSGYYYMTHFFEDLHEVSQH